MEALQRTAESDTLGPAVDQQEVVEKPSTLDFRFVRLSRFVAGDCDSGADVTTPAETLYVVLDGEDAASVTFSHGWWDDTGLDDSRPEPDCHPAAGGLPHYHVRTYPGSGADPEVAEISHHARREGDSDVEADPEAISRWISERLALTIDEREAVEQTIRSSSLPW